LEKDILKMIDNNPINIQKAKWSTTLAILQEIIIERKKAWFAFCSGTIDGCEYRGWMW
jgi:hypothetical protein